MTRTNTYLLFVLSALIITVGCTTRGEPQGNPPAMVMDKELMDKINDLITKLGADDFETRELASAELTGIGEPALVFLQKAMKNSDDPEVRMRARKLVDEDIPWTERIKNLPRTFGTQYYNWYISGRKVGYMRLAIEEARDENTPVFKISGHWQSNKLARRGAVIDIVSYARKNKYLTPLSEECKMTGDTNCNYQLKVNGKQGLITIQIKQMGLTIPLSQSVCIPDNLVTWEGAFICAAALPFKPNLSFSYSIFILCPQHGYEQVRTEPIRFSGEEEITWQNRTIKCYKFTGKFQDYHTTCWIGPDRNTIKISAEGYGYEFVLTDKDDALK